MRKKLCYREAQILIKKHLVTSASEYRDFRTSDEDLKSKLPYQPMVFYKEDWKGWDDFTSFKNKELDIDIRMLQKIAEQLNIKTKADYNQAIKDNLIGSPISISKIKGFSNWSNFFHQSEYISFEDLLIFTRSLSLKSQMDWREWCKNNERPKDVPFNLRKIYYDDFTRVCFDHKYSFWKFIFVG
ncbi:hypothetical protein ACRN9G_18695 [Shewanella frigidimarina]|uniref:hypothetical protein n=1 Tax=Shewanella frigidimarina TaxID=56812 RepID=UPI003D7A6525